MRVYPLPVLSFTFPAMRQYCCPAMPVSFRHQNSAVQSANLVVAKCCNYVVCLNPRFAPDMSTATLPARTAARWGTVPPPAAWRPLSKRPIVSNSRVKRSPGVYGVQLIVTGLRMIAPFCPLNSNILPPFPSSINSGVHALNLCNRLV